MKKIIIISPSLNPNKNVSGISAVTGFIIRNNSEYNYKHFELGKFDDEKRGVYWFLKNILAWLSWFRLMLVDWKTTIHFNIALTKRSLLRDLPLIMGAQTFNKKMVIHLHGGEFLEEQKPPQWATFLLKISLSGRNPKIVLSQIEKDLVIKRYNAKNVYVLPNSIDLTDARGYDGNKPADLPLNLLFIGRIDRNKGLDDIYKALSIVKANKEIQFRFIMAGSGPDKTEFLKKFTELLGNSFEYKGVIAGKEKADVFKISHIFLLPSLYEGLPISLLENMAYGNVPVVTNVGSIGTVVTHGKNGIIVSKKSAEEIANAIEKLSSDTKMLRQLSANARQEIFDNFNPAVYIQKLNNLYKQLTNKEEIKSEIRSNGFSFNMKFLIVDKVKWLSRFFNYLKKHRVLF